VVAPVAVTDSYRGYPLVGTTAAFATDGGRLGPVEGRMFDRVGEALIGAAVDLPLGVRIRPTHGSAAENVLETHEHEATSVVVGRLARTGTAWDRAIVVPIEAVWAMHADAAHRDVAASAATLGPPWSPEVAGPVPAIAVRPRSVNDAYRLRQQYRGKETIALFPAEVLNPLYALLGDVSGLMRGMALAFDALLAASVVLAIAAVLAARRGSLGVLRALGAPPRFVFATVWLVGALLVAAGAVGGLALGALFTLLASGAASSRLGFAIDATIGVPEVVTALALLVGGSLLAAVPSLVAMRTPVGRLLRAS
jgi:putative ABC transport system permease protein